MSASNARHGSSKKKPKKSMLQMDLGSLGRKSAASPEDDVVHEDFEPELPHVNLVPMKVRDSIALKKVRRGLIAVGLLLAVCAGGFWYLQGNQVGDAEARLAVAQTENTALAKRVAALAPVQEFYTQLSTQQKIVETTMAAQPQAALIVTRLIDAAQAAGGKYIQITGLNITYDGIPEPGAELNKCASPDPFGDDITVGCVSFTATARNRQQVADLLRAMTADPLFVGPYVASTSFINDEASARNQVTFTGTTGISPDGLKTVLTDEQIHLLRNPPAPTASANPEAGGE